MSEEALLTKKTELTAHYSTNDSKEPRYIKQHSPGPATEDNVVVETNDLKLAELSLVSDSMANMAADGSSSEDGVSASQTQVTISEVQERGPVVSLNDVLPTNPVVLFDTSLGRIGFELFLSDCPVTVSHFVDLVETGFYDLTQIHYVVRGFMIRLGCPHSENPDSELIGTGHAEPNSEFENLKTNKTEFRDSEGCVKDEFLIQRSNSYLTLGLANRGVRHSGSSQFFINLDDNTYLDWFQNERCPDKHLVFGRVIWGEDIVRSLGRVSLAEDGSLRPKKPIRINGAMRTSLDEMRKPINKQSYGSRFSVNI